MDVCDGEKAIDRGEINREEWEKVVSMKKIQVNENSYHALPYTLLPLIFDIHRFYIYSSIARSTFNFERLCTSLNV